MMFSQRASVIWEVADNAQANASSVLAYETIVSAIRPARFLWLDFHYLTLDSRNRSYRAMDYG